MDAKKRILAEWVLTNGTLPGFEERVKASLSEWSVVGPQGMVVYRAQGGGVTPVPAGAPPPNVLTPGLRPVLATSKDPSAIQRYAGTQCCIFKITLAPGVRFIDVTAEYDLALEDDVLRDIRKMCPLKKPWPLASTPLDEMRSAIVGRCAGRTKYKGTRREEIIPPEQEVMVYGLDGQFSDPQDAGMFGTIRAYEVTYSPKRGGYRGRTLRRNAVRMNKNGRRSTRKSEDFRRRRS